MKTFTDNYLHYIRDKRIKKALFNKIIQKNMYDNKKIYILIRYDII